MRRRRPPPTIRGSGRTPAGVCNAPSRHDQRAASKQAHNQASKHLVRRAAARERGATRSARTFGAPSGGLAIFLSSPSCGDSLAQSTSVEASRMDGQKSPATQMRDVIRGHQRSSLQKSPATQMSHAERDAGRSHRSVRCGHLTAWRAQARGASTFSVAHVDAPRARVAKLSEPTVHHGSLWHDSEGVLLERVERAVGLPGEWLARAERHLAEVCRTESAPVRHVQGLVREDAHASGVVGGGDVGHHYGERVGDPCIHTGRPGGRGDALTTGRSAGGATLAQRDVGRWAPPSRVARIPSASRIQPM